MEAAILSLVQFRRGGARGVAGLDGNGRARLVADTSTTLELARRAIAEHVGLAELAERLMNEELDLSVRRGGFAWWNVPPASVYVYTRNRSRAVHAVKVAAKKS